MAASWQKVFESGNLMYGGGIYEAAFKKYSEALELAISAGDQSWIGDSTRAMARTYLAVGKLEEAEQLALQAETVDRAFWGCENQQVADDIFIQAEAKLAKGLLGEARANFDHTLAIRMEVLGEDHDDTLATLIRLMWIDLEDGVSQHALLAHMKQASGVFARLHPYGSFAKALNIHKLLRRYVEQEKLQEANVLVERLLRAMRTVFGNTHPEITQILADCSDVQQDSNKQLAAWRLKTRSDVMNRATSENVWLAQMEGKSNPDLQTGGNTAYGAPTFRPDDETDQHFMDAPAYANKPTIFQVQPNPYAQPASPPPPDPFALPIAPPDPFAQPQPPMPPDPLAQSQPIAPPDPMAHLKPIAPAAPFAPAMPPPNSPTNEMSVVVANLNPVKPVAPMPSQFREELAALEAAHEHTVSDQAEDEIDRDDFGEDERIEPVSLQSRSAVHSMPSLPIQIQKRSLFEGALARAGFEITPQKFGNVWLCLAGLAGLLSALTYALSSFPWLCLQAFMLGFVLGTSGVTLFLCISIARYQNALVKNLPDALEIMVSELRQGVPVADTLVFLSQTGPVSMRREFTRAVKVLESGKSVKEAITELAYFVRAPEMRQLADRVKASHTTGQGLAEGVAQLAKSCRDRQSSKGIKRNDSSRMTIAMLIGGCLIWLPAIRLIVFPAVGAATFSSPIAMLFLTIMFLSCVFASIACRTKGQDAWADSAEQTTEKFFQSLNRGRMAGELRRELVDFLEITIMYTESGVSVPQAVMQVSQNSTSSCPMLCAEVQRAMTDMKTFKGAVPNAFRSIGKQYGVEELVAVAGTIEAAERTRSSVSHQLREQAKSLKDHLKYSSGAKGILGLLFFLLGLYFLARILGF